MIIISVIGVVLAICWRIWGIHQDVKLEFKLKYPEAQGALDEINALSKAKKQEQRTQLAARLCRRA